MSDHARSSVKTALFLAGAVLALLALAILLLMRAPSPVVVRVPDLVNATKQQARQLGLLLPRGARGIYLQSRQGQGRSCRFVRFDLPREVFAAYQVKLARRPRARMGMELSLPASWPSLQEPIPGSAGTGAPDWWLEHRGQPATVKVIVEGRTELAGASGEPGRVGGGEYWIMDQVHYRVYLWSWSSAGFGKARQQRLTFLEQGKTHQWQAHS